MTTADNGKHKRKDRKMEYKFTFEDGSSAYLSHYGVKGMKKGKHIKAKDEDYLRSLGLLSDVAKNVADTAQTASQTVTGFASGAVSKIGQGASNLATVPQAGKEVAAKAKNKLDSVLDAGRKTVEQAKHDVHMADLERKSKDISVNKSDTHPDWYSEREKHGKGRKFHYNSVDKDGIGHRSLEQTLSNGRKRSWNEYTVDGGKSWKSQRDAFNQAIGKGKQQSTTASSPKKISDSKLSDDFKKIDRQTNIKKMIIDAKHKQDSNPVHMFARATAARNKGRGYGTLGTEVVKETYKSVAQNPVEKALADLSGSYKKYQAVMERSNSMTEAEKDALRKKLRSQRAGR